MRTWLVMKRFSIGLLLCSMSGYLAAGPVVWNNNYETCGGGNGPIVGEFIDQTPITVLGLNAFQGKVQVQALNTDVSINIPSSAVLTGASGCSDEDSPAPAQLYLYGERNHTINFQILDDLLFRGTSFMGEQFDLQVTVSGDVNVLFTISGDYSVTFSSEPASGGTRFYLLIDDNAVPSIEFERNNTNPTGAAIVGVGPKSIMSYVAGSGATNPQGSIIFDPTNSSTGRLVLAIDDSGSVVISAAACDTTFATLIDASNIDLISNPVSTARMVIAGVPNTCCGLMVANYNETMPLFANNSFVNDAFADSSPTAISRPGFFIDRGGQLIVENNAYLDYVGVSRNINPAPILTPEVARGEDPETLVKLRNPSAFFADDNDTVVVRDGSSPNPPALIDMQGSSKLVFRSGVKEDGSYNDDYDSINVFTMVCTEGNTATYGNIVFDVEGELNIVGEQGQENAIELLSLQVTSTGGSVIMGGSQTTFPQRTFVTNNDGKYLQYNIGSFLINGRLNLTNIIWMHTDESHFVQEKNDQVTEAAYVGGETYTLDPERPERDGIYLYSSTLNVHTDIAFAGVDVRVPNTEEGASSNNTCMMTFFANGLCLDQGKGRNCILGTNIGGSAVIEGFFIGHRENICLPELDWQTTNLRGRDTAGREAHLDVFQEWGDGDVPTGALNVLVLGSGANDASIHWEITGDISSQPSLHSIYLGSNSNISCGGNGLTGVDPNGSSFPFTRPEVFLINGNFFSFESRGGTQLGQPDTAASSGVGGIFVDTEGIVTITNGIRAVLNAMPVKSGNGQIDLPKSQVNYGITIGSSVWRLDLNDPDQRVLVSEGARISDLILDWNMTTKNCTEWVPYVVTTLSDCSAPAVIPNNLVDLPLIEGSVEHLHLLGSKLGDPIHLIIRGGAVDELISGIRYSSGELANPVVILEEEGRLGLGKRLKTLDSTQSPTVMGVNGVMVIPNGYGTIRMNEDVIVSNVCPLMAGPDFGAEEFQALVIHSDVPREFRVQGDGGILDLRSFTTPNQAIKFSGQAALVLEPGAQLMLGGGPLIFTEDSCLRCETNVLLSPLDPVDATATDPMRVKIMGVGDIIFRDRSSCEIPEGALIGVETNAECNIITTTLNVGIYDYAQLCIGDLLGNPGGGLQIGNVEDNDAHSVSFVLTITGQSAQVNIQPRGLLGLGVGVVSKPTGQSPNNWELQALYNVGSISLDIQSGYLNHRQISSGSCSTGALMAIGPDGLGTYSVTLHDHSGRIRGGANMVRYTSTTPASLPVTNVYSPDTDPSAGILASSPILREDSKRALRALAAAGTDSETFWTFLQAPPLQTMSDPRACTFQDNLGRLIVSYVLNGSIWRYSVPFIIGVNGGEFPRAEAANAGTVHTIINTDQTAITHWMGSTAELETGLVTSEVICEVPSTVPPTRRPVYYGRRSRF